MVVENITGRKFGRWTVTSKRRKSRKPDAAGAFRFLWKCICDCGKTGFVSTSQLKAGGSKSCGCLLTETRKCRAKDMVGQVFGQLTVVSRAGTNKTKNGTQRATFLCRCRCGNEVEKIGAVLRNGIGISCGCQSTSKYENPKQAEINKKLSIYRTDALRRGFDWLLTVTETMELLKGNCHYCDIEPKQVAKGVRQNGDFVYNGIDRMDNNKGYLKENTVSCCKMCNFMKRSMDYTTFITQCVNVSKNRGSYNG